MTRAAVACALAAGLIASRGLASPGECAGEELRWPVGRLAAEDSPLDLRLLGDRPAGRRGFLRSSGDGFTFADGTPARLLGVNVAAGAIFRSSDDEIDRHAERIARLGFNIVRLHHHDSSGWIPEALVADGATSGRLAPAALEKMDRWIARLREQGVYVWLDLHAGRPFRAGDEIPGFAEIDAKKLRSGGSGQGFSYVNPRVEELMLDFAVALLSHRNRWTGLRYVDDPAIALVLITNENDLVTHFGNRLSARENPWHRQRLLVSARAFARDVGGSPEALMETWRPGPARMHLAHLEHAWWQRARTRLREAGLRVPLTLTSFWSKQPLAALASLGASDFVDVHAYGSQDSLRTDPREHGGFLTRIAAGQIAERPLAVSEWNLREPLEERRFVGPLWIAGVGALQDWDALLLYAYAHRPLQRLGRSSSYASAADPAILALTPAAAVAYRRADLTRARERFVIRPDVQATFGSDLLPERMPAIATLVERSRVAIALPRVRELPWLRPTSAKGARAVSDPVRSFLPPGAREVVSDTGELRRSFGDGFATWDSPRSQAAFGAIANRRIALSGVSIRADRDAAVAFTSLDGLPLPASRRVLVTAVARACADGGRAGAFRSEPIAGEARLGGSLRRALTPLRANGERGEPVALTAEAGGSRIALDFGAHWALIEPREHGAP